MPTYRRKSFLYLSIVVDFLSLLRSFNNRSLFTGAVCFALAPAYGLSSLTGLILNKIAP